MGYAVLTVLVHIDEKEKKVFGSVLTNIYADKEKKEQFFSEQFSYSKCEVRELGWKNFWVRLGRIGEMQIEKSGEIQGA